ncbi:MAG: L-threonylcarbamoyladenylate synthase [Planctomycetota bacterium]|nr:L-threonylcarbamoyladenylate synthase [Planctomycetota bacterium]
MNSDRILEPTPEHVERCARHLREGGLVGMPTETVYGLAADACDQEAVRRIYRAKSRPAGNPLIVHVARAEQARSFCEQWDDRCQQLADAFWPGPLTLVLKRSALASDSITAGQSTVAVRSPAHDVARALIEAADRALVAPSANQSGHVSSTTAAHVITEFPELEFPVLDGGMCALGIESTVLDLTGDHPIVLRPGAVTARALRNVLPDLEVPVIGEQGASPGTAPRHYAPHTPTELVTGGEIQDRLAGCSAPITVLSIGPRRVGVPHASVEMPDDPDAYARKLYAGLREADESDGSLILIESPPGTDGLWRAINDRLQRACAPPVSS